MRSTKYLSLLKNNTSFLRKDSETLESEGNKRTIKYRGHILRRTSQKKSELKWKKIVSNTFPRTWKVCVIVSPWWKASYLMVTPLFRWPTRQVEKSQLVSRPAHLTTLTPHQGDFSQCNKETWERLSWREKGLEENISQGGISEFNKIVTKKRYLLYMITVLAEKEIFPFWSWCLENWIFYTISTCSCLLFQSH